MYIHIYIIHSVYSHAIHCCWICTSPLGLITLSCAPVVACLILPVIRDESRVLTLASFDRVLYTRTSSSIV